MDVRDRSICFLHNWGEDEVEFTPALPDQYPLWHSHTFDEALPNAGRAAPNSVDSLLRVFSREVTNSDVGVNNQNICPYQ